MNVETKHSALKRFLTLLLSVMMVFSLIPNNVFAAMNERDVITNITALKKTTYNVENGTALSDVGLPKNLDATISTPSLEEGGEAVVRKGTLAVSWEGDYQATTAGTYTLTAKFADSSVVYAGEMPKVTVIVAEALLTDEAKDENQPKANNNASPRVNYAPGDAGLELAITNLRMTPDADIWPGTRSTLDFSWSVAFIGVQKYFQNGDTVTIPTNIGDLYNFNGGWNYNIALANGTVVASFTAHSDKFVITFNQAAEDMKLTSLSGSFENYFEKPTSKNLDLPADATQVLTVANSNANVGFKGGKHLTVSSSGSGSAAFTNGGNDMIFTAGQSVEITGTPNSGETLEKVVLRKADGTSQELTAVDGKVTISFDDLKNGKNSVVYQFSSTSSGGGEGGGKIPMSEWRWDGKGYWGTEKPSGSVLATSARFNVEIGYQALLGLYQNEGQSLMHFGNNNAYNNVFLEDTLPGGNYGKFAGNKEGTGVPRIFALLADYTTITNSESKVVTSPVHISETGQLTQTDIIASGHLSEVSQNANESIESFRGRVKNTPLTWGIYVDPATDISTFMVNLGSPGDANGTAIKATDLWPSLLAGDPKLNTLNGANNCVGGNVVAFRIDYFGNYAGAPYTMHNLTNVMKLSYTDGADASKDTDFTSGVYTIMGNTSLSIPGTGFLNVTKQDALTGAPIKGAAFKVQTQDASGAWVDYQTAGGTTVEGTTDASGFVSLGVMTVGKYRVIEVSVPAPYDKETVQYLSVGGVAISNSGEFEVKANDVEGTASVATNIKKFHVNYHANGGVGTLVDPNNPYSENALWTPLPAGTSITRDGYDFVGWNTKADGTGDDLVVGSSHTITTNVDLYAKWKQKFTVSFDTNGGTPATIASQTVFLNDLATEPTAPQKTDKIFGGWYYTKDGVETKWDFNTPVTENLALVAKWNDPAGATVNMTGSKTLTGGGKTDADIKANQFSFTVTADANNPVDGVTGLPTGDVNVAAGGAIDFGAWSFSKEGTYVFTVSENTPAAGYTKGEDVTVTVAVTLNTTTNALETAVTYSSGTTLTIENTYTAPDEIDLPEAPLRGIKILNGNTVQTGQFEFSLTEALGNPTGSTINNATTTNTMENISFGDAAITFNQAGTYKFVVAETGVAPAGYTYDTKPVTVTIPVTLNTATNTLEVGTVTYEKDGQAITVIQFVNEYQTPDGAVAKFRGTKTLTENGVAKAMTNGQFTVAIAEDAGNDATGYTGFVAGNKDIAPDGTFSFDEMTFTKEGTYKFTITENNLGEAGYTYDDKAVTATVVVTLDATSNMLNSVVTYEKDSVATTTITFENTYTAPAAVGTTFDGTKTLTENGVAKPMTNGQFTVAIVEDVANDATGYTGFVAGNKDVAADGTFSFDEISFTKAGTYKFIITENNLGEAGYTYDNKAVTATVVVSLDETDNTLKPVVTYEKDSATITAITFANTYATPAASDIFVNGVKTLTENGENKAMTAGKFSFSIVADNSNDATGYTGFTAGSVDVAENGSFDFGTLSFTKVGTYKFNITEDDKGAAGYAYDNKMVVLTVEVSLNTVTNELEAVATYSEEGTVVPTLTFANTYTTPDATDVILSGNKTLSGNRTTDDIVADEFTFAVAEDASNNALGYTGLNNTAKVDVGGAIDFGTLSFSKAGTYQFTVSENNLGKTGYTYDTTKYLITVTVTLNTTTNQLETETKMEKIGTSANDEVNEITFANIYTPNSVIVDPPVEKVVTGNPDTAGNFTFLFKAENADNPMPEGSENGVKEMTIKGAGSVEFGNMEFTKTGTYVYTISEKNNGETGYSYDETVYTITCVVTDNDGNLEAERTITANGNTSDKAVFTNKYTAPEVPTVKPNAPQTGDTTNMAIPLGLLALSLGGICLIILKRKKQGK